MHHVSSMKMWEHDYHGATQYGFVIRMPQWTRKEILWTIAGISLMLGVLVILMMHGIAKPGSRDIMNQIDSPAVPEEPWAVVWKGKMA